MRNVSKRWFASAFLAPIFCLICQAQEPSAAPPAEGEKLARVLRGVGEAVERYHAGLFSIKFTETWRWEQLSKELTPKKTREFVFDDFVVRFRRVEFKDPAQTLLLPESSEWLRVIEGASRPRVRVRQTFTDYQRYVSDVKVIEDAEPEN